MSSINIDGRIIYTSRTRLSVINTTGPARFRGVSYLLTNRGTTEVWINDQVLLNPNEAWSPANSGSIPTYYDDTFRIRFGAYVGTGGSANILEVSESIIDEIETILCNDSSC